METLIDAPHIYLDGQGERIVFLHGSNIANPRFLWLPQFSLAARYQLLIPDRRGYGANTAESDKGTYEGNVEDIVSWLGQGAHLVGHSYGGLLAMVAATRHPELIKSLVIIEPPAFGLTLQYPEVARVVHALKRVYASSPTPEVFLEGFLRALGSSIAEPLHLSPLHRKAVSATMEEIEPWNIPLDLETLSACPFPKLVVSGDWHPALMITAETLAQRLHARRFVVKGVGHEIQKTGAIFNTQLEEFMRHHRHIHDQPGSTTGSNGAPGQCDTYDPEAVHETDGHYTHRQSCAHRPCQQ